MSKKLTLEVLYSDGTVSNEYDGSKKVIAVVSGRTNVGLKNTIKTGWNIVYDSCERMSGKEYDAFLAPIAYLEFWYQDIDNINATIRELKELGVNADEIHTVETYWSSSNVLGVSKTLTFPLGQINTSAHTMPHYGRAAIAMK